MDSIGDNVMAIICVVVGILIIGCALVPIVDNASTITTDTTETEVFSGYNTTSDTTFVGEIGDTTIVSDGNSTIVNNETYTGNDVKLYSRIGGPAIIQVSANHVITVNTQAFDEASSTTLTTGTITYLDGVLTVTGTGYSNSKEYASIFFKDAQRLSGFDDTSLYAVMSSPFIIGEDQAAVYGLVTITIDSEELPEGISMVKDEDTHTATITYSSGSVYGPYKWESTVTTGEITTETSEYANLYQMIPVLCILGMAYVLIRRFY